MPDKLWLAVAVIVSCLLDVVDAHAQEQRPDFTGLWQGVDNVDDSLRTLTIADLEGDGIWEVRGHDTYWTHSKGPNALQDTTGNASNGILRTTGTVRCADGQEVAIETTYTPHGPVADGVIIERVVGEAFRTLLFRLNR